MRHEHMLQSCVENPKLMEPKPCSVSGAGHMGKVEQHTAKMSEPGNRERRCLTLLSTAEVGVGIPAHSSHQVYSDTC